MNLYCAPLQGYTEIPWRKYHNNIFGGITNYYTPFMRIERGEIRKKDFRDINPENNIDVPIIPQIIATNPDHAMMMTEAILKNGYSEVDINFGCPFPPITGKHQGSGMLPHPNEVKILLDALSSFKNDIKFSIKTRLGLISNNDIFNILPLYEDFNPTHITIHPRNGKQQYKGDLDMETFKAIYDKTIIPLIYNGNIQTIEDIKNIETEFPKLKGIMVGRGLLANPALAREYNGGLPLSLAEYLDFHNNVFQYYRNWLDGDTQILSKIKPFWEYAPEFIDRKILKAIKKSGTLEKYESAISKI